jgi:hypothetical protein
VPEQMAKMMKSEMFLVGDIRDLSKISKEMYAIRSINGNPQSSFKDGVLYKAEEMVVEGPIDITNVKVLNFLIDMGVISHENEEGEVDLLYKLAKNNAVSATASKWLFDDAKSKGFNYDIEKLRSEAGSFISLLCVYAVNK